MTAEQSNSRICIGRFELSTPLGLVMQGRSQSIYRVDVGTVRLPPEGLDAVWKERLRSIRSMTPPPGAQDRVIRTYDLQPGTRAIWLYDSSESINVVRLEAFRPLGDHVLLAAASGDDDRQSMIETLVKNVVNAYVPDARQGFCVERGAIASEPGYNEATQSTFKHATLPDFGFNFNTQTVKEPTPPDRLSDVREMNQMMGPGTQITLLSSGRRVAAGLEGLEERFSVAPSSQPPFIRYSWKYGGQSLRSDAPQIMLVAVAKKENQPELTQAWEAFLVSLRPVPMVPKAGR